MDTTTRTRVAIVGAGPAGMLLSHLLAHDGIDSVIVEARTREYVLGRIRAGILEDSTVALLRAAGLGERLTREGLEHRGIYLHTPGHTAHIDFVDLIGRSVWVYGQTEVQKDLVAARAAGGQEIHYASSDVRLADVTTDSPSVSFTGPDGRRHSVVADAVVGCDGSFGPSRHAVPGAAANTFERVYPYSWLGILADVAPSTDELIYARHPRGFAMHSMRSHTVSRLYLQVPNGTDPGAWSDQRIWDELALRLGDGRDGWTLAPGPITDRSVLPMRSFVHTPMRYGNLFLAGDAAHIVPPTGAKGLNLAVGDIALLAPALVRWLHKGDEDLALTYSDRALQRVWQSTYFSWWMTSMLHVGDDPFDAALAQAQLRAVMTSGAQAQMLAENYAGLPF